MEVDRIFRRIDASKQEMIDALIQILRLPAIGPENDGEGEQTKAQLLMSILGEVGFDRIDRFDSDDPRVPSGKRPNIVAYLQGDADVKRLWIVTHLDVVPPGEESQWTMTPPFRPIVKNNSVFGRGSEDNGQSLIASIFACKVLKELGIKPKRTLALAFVADEEQGSTHGIQFLISKRLFRTDDLVLVPDSGTPKGDFIEIAEKSILWVKVVTIGKQTHGSLPNKGLNAHRIGMQLALTLDEALHHKYNLKNDHFSPPISTFEPTRKEKNVDAVNIVPGQDAFFFDCRILPEYNVEDVLSDIESIAADFEVKTGARISIEVLQKQATPAESDENAEIVLILKKALVLARGVIASVGGIGGGTCAAFFRKIGVPAVVWSTINEVAHQPNEYCKIENIIGDAKVFALLSII